MATKKKSTSAKPVKRRARYERRETVRRKSKGLKGLFSGINWGEALLFGVAGYEVGNVLNETGISEAIYAKLPANNILREQINTAFGISNGKLQGGNTMMKDAGLIGLGKVGYDAAKGKMSVGDKNAILPFSIGAILDPAKPNGSSNGERW